MSHVIQDTIRDGSCTLLHDYRAGHLLDLSGNGYHGVGTNIRFVRDGLAPTYLTNGYVTVSDCTLFDANKQGTIFFLVKNQQSTDFNKYCNYTTDSGNTIQPHTFSSGRYRLYDGLTSVVTAAAASGSDNFVSNESVCFVFGDGDIPEMYVRGYFYQNFSGTQSYPNDMGNGDLIVGETGGIYLDATLQAVYVNKTKLTATQIRNLHLELLK